MHHSHTPDALGPMGSPRLRSASLSVENSPQFQRSSMFSPPLVMPQPQYVAAGPAAQIVAAVLELDASGGVQITPASLNLINGFLDHILFNILLAARSTKLIAIRPAVSEVLKPRLAKEVVSAADEELREYMGGGVDEELSDFHGGQEPSGHFELERSWKLTRLRCMVYTRLGDMEEEDEEEHLHREGLDDGSMRPGRFSSNVGHITPAAAIFLTSILEYLGESALALAGEAACNRVAASKRAGDSDGSNETEELTELVLEDVDVEKLALNATLGRLWRTWRKSLRVPMLSRTLSRESLVRRGRFRSKSNSRQSSIATVDPIDELYVPPRSQEPSVSEAAESVDPAEIPLPMTEKDVEEIEFPSFTGSLAIAVPARSVRPRSLFLTSVQPSTPGLNDLRQPQSAGPRFHVRSSSLPENADKPTPATHSRDDHDHQDEGEDEHDDEEEMEHAEAEIEEIAVQRDPLPDSGPPQTARLAIVIPGTGGSRLSRVGRSEDDASSAVSSLHSPTAPATALSEHSAPPSPISPEEAEMMQARAEQSVSRKARRDQPVVVEQIQNFQTSQSPSMSDAQHSPQPIPERSTKRIAGPQTPSRSNNAYQPEQEGTSQSSAIVETSFVSQNGRTGTQRPRLTPLTESAGSSPARESPQSASRRHAFTPTHDPKLSTTESHRLHSTPKTQTSPVRAQAPDSGVDRAAVQRISPPPSAHRDSSGSRPRRSESFTSKRPKTSDSNRSQVSNKFKGFINRQHADSVSRTSTDVNKTSFTAAEHCREPSDLDSLIQSDETIHFTLTPRTMRDIEKPDSPRWKAVRGDTDDVPDLPLRERGFSESTSNSTAKRKEVGSPISRKQGFQAPRNRTSVLAAREPTTELESLREFAEFIRSTGPDEPNMKSASRNGRPGGMSNGGSNFAQSQSPSAPPRRSQSTQVSNSRPPANKLKAREPVAQRETAADLIEFIRDGPPPTQGAHRNPKKSGLLRAATDSDDFPSSSANTSMQDVSIRSKSVNSSNSRTGLLESAHRSDGRMRVAQPSALHSIPSPPRNTGPPPRKQRGARDPYAIDSDEDEDVFDEMPKPRRTRPRKRGPRDPYAIDTDSDEEEIGEISNGRGAGSSRGGHQKEESLAEFLRNATPPPDTQQRPQMSASRQEAQQSSSSRAAAAIKSRVMRSPSLTKGPRTKGSFASFQSAKSGGTASSYAQPNGTMRPQRSFSQRQGPKGFPESPIHIQNGARPPSQSTGTARSPALYKTETAALADFLKNTGPPPAPNRGPEDGKESKSAAFSRMLLRKKKQF